MPIDVSLLDKLATEADLNDVLNLDQDNPIEDEVNEEIVTNAATTAPQPSQKSGNTLLSQLSLFASTNNQKIAFFTTMPTNRPSK